MLLEKMLHLETTLVIVESETDNSYNYVYF